MEHSVALKWRREISGARPRIFSVSSFVLAQVENRRH
jgi:hypothetical protein